MSGDESLLKGKHILAVDDEEDILETIEDILDQSIIDKARDYENASEKIKAGKYDLVILDIMGVRGLELLEESVERSEANTDKHNKLNQREINLRLLDINTKEFI